ncbi:MAG: acetate--CoA ligase family protein, partial [Deltaproteobacteria bacterium]|nr:acetate--CoA ligase family protein [Deltaproteobacteria bacterium]
VYKRQDLHRALIEATLLLDHAAAADGVEGVLISNQITDKREFLLGLKYDLQFGYTVVFGLGGIFTEALKDISIKVCPLSEQDAEDMLSEIKSSGLLSQVRGYPAIDTVKLIKMILNLSRLPEAINEISEIDINPVMFDKGEPLAADALIVLK